MRRIEPDRAGGDRRPGGYRPVSQGPGPARRFGQPERPPFRGPAHRGEAEPAPWVASAEMLGPGEELIAGRRPVEEAFAARRPALRLLVTPQRRMALERIVLHATTLRIPIVEVEGGTLTALSGFDGHQGVALVVGPRVFAGVDDILARAIERGEPAFVLVLDSLEDPQNLGTVLRSAEAAGVHGVLFPTARQAPLSAAAVKASAGATEHLLLCPVDDLAGALVDLHARGLQIVGTEADAPLTARQADLRGPIAIVIGSEGHGLSPAVRRRSDLMVRIPMRGMIGSLNAAVAGSILLFEALGQRDPEARPRMPTPTAPAGSDAGTSADPAAEPGAEAEPAAEAAPTKSARATSRAKAAKATNATKAAKATNATKAAKATKAATMRKAPTAEEPSAAAPKPAPRPRARRATRPVPSAVALENPAPDGGPDASAAAREGAGDDLLPGGPDRSA